MFAKHITVLAVGLIGLLTAHVVNAMPQSGAGAGCDIILNDSKYDRLLGCARGNVPQNYTSADEMKRALDVFCADNHKCKESEIRLFLTGLLQSCGSDAATNPNNRAYKKFRDLYTAVPRWESYCRVDSKGERCLMKPDEKGMYGPRTHSFTCDECGRLRVDTYVAWENRTASLYGRPESLIQSDLTRYNEKCPDIKPVDLNDDEKDKDDEEDEEDSDNPSNKDDATDEDDNTNTSADSTSNAQSFANNPAVLLLALSAVAFAMH
jgi:hypothetical protein